MYFFFKEVSIPLQISKSQLYIARNVHKTTEMIAYSIQN